MPQPQRAQTVTPNLYQLSGQHIHLSYSTSSFDGKPTMSYQDAHESKSFRGDEIRTVECDLGTLVSVTIRLTIDVGSTTLSLFIPNIRLLPGTTAHVRTDCVTTRHSMPFTANVVQGQLDTYQVTSLHGTAQRVDF